LTPSPEELRRICNEALARGAARGGFPRQGRARFRARMAARVAVCAAILAPLIWYALTR
jgi:hypothetical protein